MVSIVARYTVNVVTTSM